jgi:[protein-PII] uridylyltransferase
MYVLTHELQERVAGMLGVPGHDPRQRVEALMRDYFRHARGVVQALAWTRAVVDPPPEPADQGPVSAHVAIGPEGAVFLDPPRAMAQPAVWLDAFEVAIAHGCPVAPEARALMQEQVGRYTADYFVATEEARRRLRAMLVPRPGLSARLAEMLECGLLGAIFPEFERIHYRVIRDFYHKYTVDEHTLLTIRNLESLRQPASASRARFGSILNEVRAPELLTIALLYHDIGKWRDDDHAVESARLAEPMLARLQLDVEDRDTVEFLIRQHLAMSQVVFRRDFGDPDTIATFAELVGTEERLKMLCLMTVVDVEAVSTETLTAFREELLWRLYVDTYNQLTLGYGDEMIERGQAALAALQAKRPADLDEAELTHFLEGLPQRYLAMFDADRVYRHAKLARDLHPDEVHLFLEQKGEVWELAVVTLDKPYLFSRISGVLSYFGMDILRGSAMSNRSQVVLDVFQFTDHDGFFRFNQGAIPQFEALLRDVVAGRQDVTALLERRESGFRRRSGLQRVAPIVYFDQEHSQRYTVLEIVAQDAIGLLYRVSRVISRHGCDVDLVLISTEGTKAIDVFHLTKAEAKLSEPAQMALKQDLERMLEEGYETH